ncbi:hypothetical protein J3F84DRAFT_401154 [Trichoderma pleuroticola]
MNNAFCIPDLGTLVKVVAFLAQDTASQNQQLYQFLRDHSIRLTLDLISPDKELPLRLELIGELRRRLQGDFGTSEEPFDFSNIQIAALFSMSLETLRDLGQDASFIMSAMIS